MLFIRRKLITYRKSTLCINYFSLITVMEKPMKRWPQAQKSAKIWGRGEKRKVPNYFLAVQITNPVIKGKIKAIQDYVATNDRRVVKTSVPVCTAHLTLAVMFLNPNDLIKATELLDASKDKVFGILNNKELILSVNSIGHFRNEVLFAKVDSDDGHNKLKKIADVMSENFAAYITDNRPFRAHLTMMKLSKLPYRNNKIKLFPEYYSNFQNLYFGKQRINGIQLLTMTERDKFGYYKLVHELKFHEPTDKVNKQTELDNYCSLMASYILLSALHGQNTDIMVENNE